MFLVVAGHRAACYIDKPSVLTTDTSAAAAAAVTMISTSHKNFIKHSLTHTGSHGPMTHVKTAMPETVTVTHQTVTPS